MTATSISPEIRRFILGRIPSVPHLEALLLLRNELHDWTAESVAERLYVSEKVATVLLGELVGGAMLEVSAEDPRRYRYQPRTDALRQLLDELAATYAAHLVEVTQMIHSKTDRKAQHFADAFKWRKDS